MVGDEAISESKFKAFGPKEWKSLYSQENNLLQEAAVTLAPFGGLSSNAVAHLRSDWIEWGNEFVKIRVPKDAECNQWKMSGPGTSIIERDEPCSYCRRAGDTNRFENQRRNGSGTHSYVATLHRDIAEPAVDVLEQVFKRLGRSGMYTTPGSVMNASSRLLSDYEHKDAYAMLLRTGVILYFHYDLEIDDIVELSPYRKNTVEKIIASTPEVTKDLHNTYSHLRTLVECEPASVQELASELGVNSRATRRTLKRLKDRNRVEVDKSEHPQKWSVVGDWTDPFMCEICGYQSPTLKGISIHKRAHDE